jgi:hypothetical protein
MLYWDQRLDYKVCLKLLKASHLTGFFRLRSLDHSKIQTLYQRSPKKYLKSPSKIEGFALYGCAAPLQTAGRTEMAPDSGYSRQPTVSVPPVDYKSPQDLQGYTAAASKDAHTHQLRGDTSELGESTEKRTQGGEASALAANGSRATPAPYRNTGGKAELKADLINLGGLGSAFTTRNCFAGVAVLAEPR